MGSVVGKAMDENMQKQQQFMLKNQQDMLERQIQLNNYMREQQMAMQLARARDLWLWWSGFYGFALIGCVAGFRRSKNPGMLAPLVPLTFILGYQTDLAVGNKMDRLRNEADLILREGYHLVSLPQPLPTLETLDDRRNKSK